MRSYLTHLTTRTIFISPGDQVKIRKLFETDAFLRFLFNHYKKRQKSDYCKRKIFAKEANPVVKPIYKKIILKIFYISGGLLTT